MNNPKPKTVSEQVYQEIATLAGTHSQALSNLMSALDVGMFSFSTSGILIYGNTSILRISGYNEQEFLQLQFLDFVHPDEKKWVEENEINKVISGEGNMQCAIRIITRQQEVRHLRIAATRISFRETPVIIGFAFDITGYIQTEKQLADNKTLLSLETTFLNELITCSPEAIVVTDKNHRIQRINPAFSELFGYLETEIKGKDINRLIALNQDLEQANSISEEIKTGNKINLETIRYHKNGTKIPVSILGAPVYIKGELTAVYGIYRDISDRINIQNDLLKNQQEMSLLMHNMPGVIYKCLNDVDWTMKYLSSGCELLTGYRENELINNQVISYANIVVEEDKEKVRTNIEQAINQDAPWESIYRIKTKHRGTLWVREIGHSIKSGEGATEYLEGFISDYSEQHKAYRYKKALFDISDATIHSKTPAELYQKIHTRLSDVMDTKNLFIALYRKETDSIRLVYITDEKDSFGEYPAGKTLTGYLMHQGKSLLTNEEEIQKLHHQGIIDMVGSACESWLGVPLKIESETIGAIVVQSYDKGFSYTYEEQQLLEFVSEHLAIAIQRINYEADLRKAKEKAEQSDMLKSAFLANMSHEIRSPMNAILGFSELLRDTENEPQVAKEYLNIVINRSKDLMVLIDEIIELSKIDAGVFKLNESHVLLNDLLRELHSFYKLEQKKHNGNPIDIRLKLPEGTEKLILFTDVPRINQVINNLVINALKFTESGYIEIGYIQKGTTLQFYVEDTGIGIPEEKQAIIFERFRQADESHTRKYQGSGLGLSIAKAILERMNGRIWVKSTPGKGTTFYFTLPISHQEPGMSPSDENIETKILEKQNPDVPKAPLILVVEDDLNNLRYMETLLRLKTISCLCASDGKKAIELVQKNPDINLILMDIRMPKMDGLEATAQLRKAGCQIPIIAQTANAMSDDRELAIAAGCNDYLAKPIKKDNLYSLLDQYL